jgi:hypothetical protein
MPKIAYRRVFIQYNVSLVIRFMAVQFKWLPNPIWHMSVLSKINILRLHGQLLYNIIEWELQMMGHFISGFKVVLFIQINCKICHHYFIINDYSLKV